jgi:hypothetical protein
MKRPASPVLALALLGLASAALAGGLPRLPKRRPAAGAERQASSPSVTTHVDATKPDCTVCHPEPSHLKTTAKRSPAPTWRRAACALP